MQLLNALNPSEIWIWWASDIKKLSQIKLTEMLVYPQELEDYVKRHLRIMGVIK